MSTVPGGVSASTLIILFLVLTGGDLGSGLGSRSCGVSLLDDLGTAGVLFCRRAGLALAPGGGVSGNAMAEGALSSLSDVMSITSLTFRLIWPAILGAAFLVVSVVEARLALASAVLARSGVSLLFVALIGVVILVTVHADCASVFCL